MFGIDTKRIKWAFSEFTTKLGDQKSPDPVVNLLVEFIKNLSEAFK